MWQRFVSRYSEDLKSQGIHIGLVVLDSNKIEGIGINHARRVARRQARHNSSGWVTQLLNIIAYRLLNGRGRRVAVETPRIRVERVPTLNGDACVKAVRGAACDWGCLMGTRILSEVTLGSLGIPLVNVHGSDPREMRGGPAFFWEILEGQPSVTLTAHHVEEKVDTGRIYLQSRVPIRYRPTLRQTLKATSDVADEISSQLFRDVLVGLKQNPLLGLKYVPGPMRVTPSIPQVIRAHRRCRVLSLGSATS